jgi:alkanesulfonate monooxygenase SsuD/methylene tetrahydromethanopterin reductase-like flavin-dependent oxidoreductase (luciferase family)
LGSSNPTIARWHGVKLDHPLGRVEEYLHITRRAMSGEKLDFEGTYFTAHGFKTAFKAGKKPVPVFLAAFGPKMSRLAGRIADGVLINMANPAEIRRIVTAVKTGAVEAGKSSETMEVICKVRCSVAARYEVAREALSHALTYYALADYYRELFGRMGFGTEVEAMRSAWRSAGFHAARELITDRLFAGLPLIAATSAREVVEQLKPYADAGATRIILPYVAASDDVVGELKSFIGHWSPAITGLNE